jgi:hypothetical protein
MLLRISNNIYIYQKGRMVTISLLIEESRDMNKRRG